MLASAACGGGKPAATTTVAAVPRIPAAVAGDLRRRAESVAGALDAGDGCTAQTRARQLVAAIAAGVNRRQIPPALLEPLAGSANDLAARIICVPPRPQPQAHPKSEPKHGHKPHKPHKRKKEGH